MVITKFYVIKVGCDENGTIDWCDDIEITEYKHGYKLYQFLPSEFPIYTTFEESEKTVFDDWSGFLCEGKYYHAKILEYTGAEYGGYYHLTHEWYYEYEDGNYHRVGEKGFEDEKS